MSILSATNSITGMVGVLPNFIFIDTNDTNATVTAAGYLTNAVKEGIISPNFQNGKPVEMAFVFTTDLGANIYQIVVTGTAPNLSYTLATPTAPSPIFDGPITSGAQGIAGGLTIFPPTALNGFMSITATNSPGNFSTSITNAAMGQSSTFTIPDPGTANASFILNNNAGTQTIATGNLTVSNGNITAGSSAPHAGTLTSFPAASGGANDKLVISAITSGGNFTSTLSNSALGQSSTYSLPDPGQATTNVLVTDGTQNQVTDYQQMIPIRNMMLAAGGGAFTLTRTAEANWTQTHTTAADTSVLGFDITQQLRAAASHGFKLTSFDVVYSIGTLAMIAHSVTIDVTTYTNNSAIVVTNFATTGALATATQAQPYVTNVTLNAPAFTNPAASTAVKAVIEITAHTDTTTVYNLMGVNLRFTRTVY